MSVTRSLSRQWRSARARVPGLAALLALSVLNLVYFAWSQQSAAAQRELAPSEVRPASIVTVSPDAVKRLQSQSAGVSSKRSKTGPALVLEYEDAPPKVIAPDR
ncbi:MAG: hypothetical protein ACKOWD_15845 [Rhodoferax sp.]